MAKLPFVVEPRRKPIIEKIGTEESGIIEIERKGYLTTGEKAFVQQVQQYDNGTTQIVTASRRVARKYSIGMEKAYSLVLSVITGQEVTNETDAEIIAKIEEEFAEDLSDVVKGLALGQMREDLVFAACMIKYRIDPDYEINDIAALHPDLITALGTLYRDEDRKSIEAFDKEEEAREVPIEELEKKPTKGSTSRSKNTTGN